MSNIRPSSLQAVPDPADAIIRDREFMVDFVLCLVVALGTVGYQMATEGMFAAALSMGMVAPLMIRRSLPRIAVGAMFTFSIMHVAATPSMPPAMVAVPIMVYTLARWTGGRVARVGLLLGLFGSILGPIRWSVWLNDYYTERWQFLGIVMIMACSSVVASGYFLGSRRREGVLNLVERQHAAAERRELMLAEKAQRVRSTAITERQRIAQELHDIVAHSLAVIVVQAEGGRALATKRPEKGPEVLGTIAETSREALAEMRQMVRLLRGGPESPGAEYVPTPGLHDLTDLIRKTGPNTELVVLGQVPHVSTAVGLTVYRIVQESLTNVLKHAGPQATARVTMTYVPGRIDLEVADDGRGAAVPSDGMGNGLRGMHERVAVHGGQIDARPRPGGGFAVRARIPIPASAKMPPW